MISKRQAEKILMRLFSGGALSCMPRKETDARVLLALAASSLIPRVKYTEEEINEHLIGWLEGFTHPKEMDHVSVRRTMVDYSLLLRDPSGSSYVTNQAVISSIITADARQVRPITIYEEVQLLREQRKQQRVDSD